MTQSTKAPGAGGRFTRDPKTKRSKRIGGTSLPKEPATRTEAPKPADAPATAKGD